MSDKKVERLIIEGFTAQEAEIGRYLWMLEDVRERLKEAVKGIDSQGLDWQPPYRGNSIGILLYHIAAVEIDWLYCEVQQTEFPAQVMAYLPFDMRDEAGRLTAVYQIPLSNHIQRLDDCRIYLLDIFNTMSLAEFRRVRHLPAYDVTPEWVLYHLIQHETEHLGQIMGVVQQFQDSRGNKKVSTRNHLMNREQILTLYDEQERKNSRLPSFRREVDGAIVRHVSKEPKQLSFVIYSDLTAETADAAIQAQIDYFAASGGSSFEWKTYDHDTPSDLKARLAAHGLQAEEEEALMVMDLQDCPPVFLQPVTADVRRAKTAAQFAQIVTIQEEVWGIDFSWLAAELNQNMALQPKYWSIYIVYVNNEPACAAWTSFPTGSQFAGLWGGSTVEKYRGQGLYTAVVATRAQEAIKRGYRFLTVDASEMSRPILEKHGFQLLTHTTPYIWKSN